MITGIYFTSFQTNTSSFSKAKIKFVQITQDTVRQRDGISTDVNMMRDTHLV